MQPVENRLGGVAEQQPLQSAAGDRPKYYDLAIELSGDHFDSLRSWHIEQVALGTADTGTSQQVAIASLHRRKVSTLHGSKVLDIR